MPRWFRLDCDVFRNPKVAALDAAQRCVWLESIAYAAEHATDGVIPDGWLANVARAPAEYADRFVEVGLWKRTRKGGYAIHDYLQKQMAADYWDAKKAAGRAGAEKRWSREMRTFAHPEDSHNDAGSIAGAIAPANATKDDRQTSTYSYPTDTPPKARKRASRAKARDDTWRSLFGCMVEVVGQRPQTRSEQGVWARAIDELRAAQATPDQVRERAQAWQRRYSLPLTPAALARHWGSLAPATTPNPDRYGRPITSTGDAA